MFTRRMRLQVGAFVLIALVGISYVGARYVGLGRVFGATGYVVQVRLADSGGIFSNAEVTYRGVTVGRVGPLRLTADGVEVDLDIDPSAPPIPADLEAVVADRSAVGEQYVDLRPKHEGGPFLASGAVIPQSVTKTPPPVDSLLTNLDSLATSVPTDSLRTVVDELDTAFQGAGPNLQVLLDNTRSFTKAAAEHLPQTTKLLADGRTVLTTQADESAAIKSFSGNLRLLAEQLKNSDGDLRKLIAVTPQVSEQVSGFLRESGPNLGVVVANLLTTANILSTRRDGLEQIFVTYPLVVAGGFTVAPGDGTAHFGLALNVFDPLPCTVGYEGTTIRPANGTYTDNAGTKRNATDPAPLNTQAYCALARGSSSAVRGAQNAPYGGQPTTPQGNQTEPQPSQEATHQGQLPGVLGLPGIGSGLNSLAKLLGLPG
ncbi:MCE family protein [Solihabitans fulvus]|uniref:MCE family protein n=1 Tax=Solihabitans fulvus TaxID=1892852 RepID=A0A5B2XP57_9PSEU|nr:MlaD family protein [Solihabitans fulvus]KAA2264750.1 MCE family protein [Solihabitans fulvus]